MTHDSFEIVVVGDPVPWARARRNGNRYFLAPQCLAFRARVQAAWLVAGRPTVGREPCEVTATFYIARAKSHSTRAGNLKANAPAYPLPDIDNLAKACLDDLQGLAWENDSQVAAITARKLFSDDPHVELEVRRVA